MFSQIKDRKHIEQNFYSVAKVMPRGGTGGAGESKTLAWGFAMAPHRLRALVKYCPQLDIMNIVPSWISVISLNIVSQLDISEKNYIPSWISVVS